MLEYKYLSWLIVWLAISINIIGLYWLFLLSFAFLFFVVGIFVIIFLNGCEASDFLKANNSIDCNEPLNHSPALGLNLGVDQKPIILITPDVREQTVTSKQKPSSSCVDVRKKSLIDSGLELLFKKNSKNIKEGIINVHHSTDSNKSSTEVINPRNLTGSGDHQRMTNEDGHKWKFFDSIKIHSEKRRCSDQTKIDANVVEECGADANESKQMPFYKLHTDSAELDQHGSPKRKHRAMLSGNKQIDDLLHTTINYILRDFIDSWFISLSDNKEFSEFRTRNCIEGSVQNVCMRIKTTQWIPIITTRFVDHVALHARYYRLANETINLSLDDPKMHKIHSSTSSRASPHRRVPVNRKSQQHRRNKSDTDLTWCTGTSQSNSRNGDADTADRTKISESETKLANAFFNQCDLYQAECLDDRALEQHLTHCMETVLYFTLPEEDFACIPLRMFLSTLLANVVCKPVIDMLSEPDFINLQIAKLVVKEPPNSEVFLRLIRTCNDLAELRACRQLITKEMDSKHKDPSATAELNSLKYTQKLIDLRISYLQNNKMDSEREKPISNLPILTFEELLNKELALSYYLDYLSILNLQKYVIFYLMAREWRSTTARCLQELQSNKSKVVYESTMRMLRDKANDIFHEYLAPGCANLLNIDAGLIEALNIRLKEHTFQPDSSWFDSICKFIYEKIKNEEIFLNNFYQSSAYRKLLLELEYYSNLNNETDLTDSNTNTIDTGSDSNSGDLPFDDDIDFVLDASPSLSFTSTSIAAAAAAVAIIPNVAPSTTAIKHTHSTNASPKHVSSFGDTSGHGQRLLNVSSTSKHFRSHSDCTGLVQDIEIEPLSSIAASRIEAPKLIQPQTVVLHVEKTINEPAIPISAETATGSVYRQRLSAKIINTAIHCDGQYAVYAIQVAVVEDNQEKSWHIYRRYSKFLDLKKNLVKRYPAIAQVPFPAKKAFQNTQRSVLEHRMTVLNEFLKIICLRADDNDDVHTILREFLEPDTNDKKIHGGSVVRTIETIVNPLKTGMRTIKNMPDSLVGGITKILLGRGSVKEPSFLDVTPVYLEQSSDYPALTSALKLLDELFDLQSRSQWLRRGLINRLLGAPWVSQTANKRIAQAAKTITEVDKIELLISTILNTIWPDGKRATQSITREESTKLRTRMAAKMALFSLLADDLKHVLGSETTRFGLLNSFSMWQHKTLNKRLILVLFNDLLKILYQTDDMTKHMTKSTKT